MNTEPCGDANKDPECCTKDATCKTELPECTKDETCMSNKAASEDKSEEKVASSEEASS